MGPADNKIVAGVCAEYISLLFLLHSVPSQPSHVEIKTPGTRVQGYVLSLEEENRLAESIAFLANDRDDVDHIPAVCVEQGSTEASLNILLAVNCVGGQSGLHSLHRLKNGFDRIFHLLQTAGYDKFKAVWHAVVLMCTKRILLRLRLARKKRGPQKKALQETLQYTIDCLKQLGKGRLGQYHASSMVFVEQAKLVIKSANNWVNHQTTVQLSELMHSIYVLKRSVNIEALLGIMTPREMESTSRTSLINIINKIARYYEISRYLYRRSMKTPWCQKMQLSIVRLPEDAYVRSSQPTVTVTMGHVLARTNGSNGNADVNRICQILKIKQAEASETIASQVTKTLTGSKVHAEIQLLYYLELNPSKFPPRIVASSKDACFLCNSFIRMHGKLHSARSHGRLYPGWRLPSIPAFVSLQHRFNDVLSREIDKSITKLLKKGERTRYKDPNESTLFRLPYSQSTLNSQMIAPAVVSRIENDAPLLGSTKRTSIDLNTQTHSSSGSLTAESKNEIDRRLPKSSEGSSKEETQYHNVWESPHLDEINGKTAKCEKTTNTIAKNAPSENTSAASDTAIAVADSDLEMIKGQTHVWKLGVRRFMAGRLHLYMEDHVQANGSTSYTLEWLENVGVERLLTTNGSSIANIEDVNDEITVQFDEQRTIHIVTEDIIVRLRADALVD